MSLDVTFFIVMQNLLMFITPVILFYAVYLMFKYDVLNEDKRLSKIAPELDDIEKTTN